VDLLLKATFCEPPNDLEQMRKTFEELYSNKALRPVLDLVALDAAKPRDPDNPESGGMRFVVANDDNVGKLYHTDDSTPPEGAYDEGANVVMFSAKGNKDFSGVVAHEMTHAAARIVHGKRVIPADDNPQAMTAYKQAIESDVRRMALMSKDDPIEAKVIDRINGRMSGYAGKSANGEKAMYQEFIVGVPQLIAEFGEDYVRKVAPGLTGFYDGFAQRCNHSAANDQRFNGVRNKVDNATLLNTVQNRTRAVAKEPWYKSDKAGQAAILEKVKSQYRTENGQVTLSDGINLVYSDTLVAIPDHQKKEYDARMKLVERGLQTAFKGNNLPAEISSEMFRDLVQRATTAAGGDSKSIEKAVANQARGFIRDTKKAAVDRKIDNRQTPTDEELAEVIVLKAEDRVLDGAFLADYEEEVEANAKKQAELIRDLTNKLKALPKEKKTDPGTLITQLSTAVAGSSAMGFYQKKKAVNKGSAHVSIDVKSAKQVWVNKLARL
jgi:hypothetical protein